MRWPFFLPVVALLAMVAVVVSACGDNGVSPPPATPTAAASPTQPPATPTPQVRQPVWTVSQRLSAEQVEIVVGDGLNEYTVVSLEPRVAEAEQWEVAFVADVNADGLDDAIVMEYSGGAHCCFLYRVFSEGPSGIQLIDSFSLGWGNARIRAVEDLDGDGMPELDTYDDRLAYFPGLSFARSPFLPLVLCRSTQHIYYDCTQYFPEVLKSSAQEVEGELGDAVQRQLEEEIKRSLALALLATYIRMGMDEEGWSKVRSLCPECEGWLTENSVELEKRLSNAQPSREAPPPKPG